MKRSYAAILTLFALLAMLVGEPARALVTLGAAEQQSRTCGCGEDGSCCCSGEGCDRSGESGRDDDQPCPCSPGPVRSLGSAPGVAAVVERRVGVGSEHADEIVVDGAGWATVVVAAVVFGPGRDDDSLSVGERLAWWCVRQV